MENDWIMVKYAILLSELDRCEYMVDYQYEGALSDYSYNGITYEQTSEMYSKVLDKMYRDFLTEWASLLDADRASARGMLELIVSKRYINGEFFFDVPSPEMIDIMVDDNGVHESSIKMARFVWEMVTVQKFYLERVLNFFTGEFKVEKENLMSPVEDGKDSQVDLPICNREYITYEELIQTYNFRGVKSAKDPKWRKKNGFDKCVRQSGGEGSAVRYSVSEINEWLQNGKTSKR